MSSFSILGNVREEAECEDIFRDLNLDIFVKEMSEGVEEYDISPYFMCLPKTKEDVLYRQGILQELDEGLENELWEFYHSLMRTKKSICYY